jgi:uncharacterized UPF0160 family protein
MVRIGTHSGTFHCDEALGCFLLKQTPQFKDADVVRTRDPKVLQDLDIVIDVGATYDPGPPLQFVHIVAQRHGNNVNPLSAPAASSFML